MQNWVCFVFTLQQMVAKLGLFWFYSDSTSCDVTILTRFSPLLSHSTYTGSSLVQTSYIRSALEHIIDEKSTACLNEVKSKRRDPSGVSTVLTPLGYPHADTVLRQIRKIRHDRKKPDFLNLSSGFWGRQQNFPRLTP